jgi:hypothetical protein
MSLVRPIGGDAWEDRESLIDAASQPAGRLMLLLMEGIGRCAPILIRLNVPLTLHNCLTRLA